LERSKKENEKEEEEKRSIKVWRPKRFAFIESRFCSQQWEKSIIQLESDVEIEKRNPE